MDQKEAQARDFARMMIQLFQGLLANMPEDMDLEKFLTFLRRAHAEPEALEEEMFRAAMQDSFAPTPAEVAELERLRRSPKTVLKGFVSEIVPSGKMGRPANFDPADSKKLLSLTRFLIPAVKALLDLNRRHKGRSLRDGIAFLAPEMPAQFSYIAVRIEALEDLLQDGKFLKPAKKIPAKATLISAALAGLEVGANRTYAVQKYREAERLNRQ